MGIETFIEGNTTGSNSASQNLREFNNNAPSFLIDGKDPKNISESPITYTEIEDPETRQTLRVAILNEEALKKGDTPTILTLQYNIGIEHKPILYLAQEMAAESKPIIIVESHSVGESSDMTRKQAKSLRENDNPFSQLSKSMYRALEPLLGNTCEIDLAGYSQGALIALSLAEQADDFGFTVKTLFALEIPGVKDFTERKKLKKTKASIGIMKAFASDAPNLSFYEKDPHDKKQREASGVDNKKNPVKTYAKLGKDLVLKPMRRKGMFTAYPAGMSRRIVPYMLKSALESQPDMRVIFINGSKSTISSSKDLNNSIPQGMQSRVRRIILPGDTHAVGERAKRIGNLYRLTTK